MNAITRPEPQASASSKASAKTSSKKSGGSSSADPAKYTDEQYETPRYPAADIYLKDNTSPARYAFAGALAVVTLGMVLFGAYRIGQMSEEKKHGKRKDEEE